MPLFKETDEVTQAIMLTAFEDKAYGDTQTLATTPRSDGRILVRSKWPRGKKPLPTGWSASEYKFGGQERWIFWHPLFGESQNERHIFERTEDDWRKEEWRQIAQRLTYPA